MSANVFKRLNVADTFVAPYTANKSWEISSSSFAEKKIITNIGVNHSGSIFDPTQDYYTNSQYDRLVYDSINLLYYPSYFPTGSPLFYSERLNSPIFDATFTSASYWKGHINLGNLDTTKYFPTTSGSVIYVLNIPKNLASEKILPNTFEIYFSSGSNYTAKIYDDGNYNLFYSGSNVSSSIGTVLSQSSYVGNVFYEQNVAVLTIVPNSIRLMGWIGDDPYCIQATAASPSVTPSITRSVSRTPSLTPTKTPSKTIPRTPSLTPTRTPSKTVSSSPGSTPSVTRTPTATPSVTITPTKTPTPSPSPSPSLDYDVWIDFYGESSPPGFSGKFVMTGEVIYGTTDANIAFDIDVNTYTTTNCSGTATLQTGWSVQVLTSSIPGTKFYDNQDLPIGSIQSSKIATMSIVLPSTSITSSPQLITIGGTIYKITGFNICNLL